VWNVNQGYLMACFEPNVTEDTIAAIAKQQPFYFVMADRSLASDNVADNFEQLFEEYSPDTQRRIL
jgi:adenine-specific DNA-methyltransferase